MATSALIRHTHALRERERGTDVLVAAHAERFNLLDRSLVVLLGHRFGVVSSNVLGIRHDGTDAWEKAEASESRRFRMYNPVRGRAGI